MMVNYVINYIFSRSENFSNKNDFNRNLIFKNTASFQEYILGLLPLAKSWKLKLMYFRVKTQEGPQDLQSSERFSVVFIIQFLCGQGRKEVGQQF